MPSGGRETRGHRVRFYRESSSATRVLGYQDDGTAAVVADVTTGEQSWIHSESMDAGRPELESALARFDELPVLESAGAVLAAQSTTSAQPVDLAAQVPGAALLQEIAAVFAAAGPDGALTEEQRARVLPFAAGFVGEEELALELARLDSARWRVLHSVRVGAGGADVDHLVIGPGGVFAVNTKHHRGQRVQVAGGGAGGGAVYVGGTFQPYLARARAEGDRVSSRLAARLGRDVPVRPVIAVVGARLTVKTAPTDVHVLDAAHLVDWLSSQAELLDPAAVEALFAESRDADTWGVLPVRGASPAVAELARRLAREYAASVSAGRGSSRKPSPGARSGSGRRRPSGRAAARAGRPGGRRVMGLRSLVARLAVLGLFLVAVATGLVGAVGEMFGRVIGSTLADQVTDSAPRTVEPTPRSGATSGPDPTSTKFLAPVSLPQKLVGASCTKGDGKARRGQHLLVCLTDPDTARRTWQYADPDKRLPLVLPGQPCDRRGDRARNAIGGGFLTCAGPATAPIWRRSPGPLPTPSAAPSST